MTAYQAVEALSAQMLQAAQRADWAAFERAHCACTGQIDALRQRAPAWSPAQASQKHAILLRILRNDAQIRRLRSGQLGQPADHESRAPVFSAFPQPDAGRLLH